MAYGYLAYLAYLPFYIKFGETVTAFNSNVLYSVALMILKTHPEVLNIRLKIPITLYLCEITL